MAGATMRPDAATLDTSSHYDSLAFRQRERIKAAFVSAAPRPLACSVVENVKWVINYAIDHDLTDSPFARY